MLRELTYSSVKVLLKKYIKKSIMELIISLCLLISLIILSIFLTKREILETVHFGIFEVSYTNVLFPSLKDGLFLLIAGFLSFSIFSILTLFSNSILIGHLIINFNNLNGMTEHALFLLYLFTKISALTILSAASFQSFKILRGIKNLKKNIKTATISLLFLSTFGFFLILLGAIFAINLQEKNTIFESFLF